MVVLQIEHKIPNFDGWKKAFDSDPIDRKKAGVCRYSILQPTNDPHFIIVNLEFNEIENAYSALAALRHLWGKVEGTIMMGPQTRILNLVECKEI